MMDWFYSFSTPSFLSCENILVSRVANKITILAFAQIFVANKCVLVLGHIFRKFMIFVGKTHVWEGTRFYKLVCLINYDFVNREQDVRVLLFKDRKQKDLSTLSYSIFIERPYASLK